MHGRLVLALLLLPLAGSLSADQAQTVTSEAVSDSVECASPGRDPDHWLIGRWTSPAPSQAVEFRREGAVIGWTYTRPRVAGADRVAVTASGGVAVMSPCVLELHGMYLTSENALQMGDVMRFNLAREPNGQLIGTITGSTGTPTQIALQRTEGQTRPIQLSGNRR
jgi:hypothetical protein